MTLPVNLEEPENFWSGSQKARVMTEGWIHADRFCPACGHFPLTRFGNNRLLSYSKVPLAVTDVALVPKHFFSPQIIERRKPLAVSARRAGWVGCNILMEGIALSGRIPLVKDGRAIAKAEIIQAWRTIFLRQADLTSKTWLLSVMACVEQLRQPVVSLQDIYSCEGELSTRFPGNRHVRAKIRQQLQVLRDQRLFGIRRAGSLQAR